MSTGICGLKKIYVSTVDAMSAESVIVTKKERVIEKVAPNHEEQMAAALTGTRWLVVILKRVK